MAITQGQITANQFNTVQDAVGSSAGQLQDQRRKYNFGDRIAELAPEESPFFVYLSQTAKLPTDDSLFRYLEDRTKIDYTSREFLIKAGGACFDAIFKASPVALRIDEEAFIYDDACVSQYPPLLPSTVK